MSLSIAQRRALLAATQAGDVVALAALFQQHDIRAAVDATERLLTTGDNRAFTDRDKWYYRPMSSRCRLRNLGTVAVDANQFEVLAWLFAPEQVAAMGKVLARIWSTVTKEAMTRQNLEMLEVLLHASASIFADHERSQELNSLIRHARRLSTAAIEVLVAHGLQIATRDALYAFADSEAVDIPSAFLAEGLFTVGADVLQSSVFNGRPDVAQHLVRLGVDSGSGTKVLHIAANREQVGVAQRLLRGSFLDVDARDAQGHTPLMHLVQPNGRGDWGGTRGVFARVLLDAGADFTLKDNDGKTALHHAVASGFTSVVEALLDHGANPNDVTNTGETVWDCVDVISGRNYRSTIKTINLLLRHDSNGPTRDAFESKFRNSCLRRLVAKLPLRDPIRRTFEVGN